MNIGKNAKIAALAGAIFALTAGAALAAPGYATGAVNVRTGPGTGYSKVDTLTRGEQVDIGQCRSGWCYVTHNGPDGWVSANYLSRSGSNGGNSGGNWNGNSGSDPDVGFSFGFGSDGAHFGFSFGNQQPNNWPRQQKRACFFTGNNYSGQQICVTGRENIAFVGNAWNDKISSVRVYNGASVTMCKHANYEGFCRTTNRNEPALGPWLNNEISSIRVR